MENRTIDFSKIQQERMEKRNALIAQKKLLSPKLEELRESDNKGIKIKIPYVVVFPKEQVQEEAI